MTMYYGQKRQYPSGICLWQVKLKEGKRCVAQFRCTHAFDLKANCSQEFFYWSKQSDARSGIKICGWEFRDFAIASKTKYLTAIVRTEGPWDRFYNGFQCQVKCRPKKDAQSFQISRNWLRLPNMESVKLNTTQQQAEHHDYHFHDFPEGMVPTLEGWRK